MNANTSTAPATSANRPNGAGAAAVLAAGIGSFLVAVFAILADQSAAIKNAMNFSHATGPLSGVTTCAILAWLAVWIALHARWRNRHLAFARVSAFALILLVLGVLLTFPPIADLF